MSARVVAAALAVAALVGCGGERGSATLWVTKDRGTHVLLVRRVPAGLTAMQALDRAAKITTRYGGRYVQSIDGVAGSLSAHHDWFYFINGYEADRSASEYRLHSGDVEWWDFRDWSRAMRQQAVVGAFPEPFLHGYAGKRLPACVVGRPRAAVRILSRLLHADGSSCDANLLVLKPGPRERFYARAPLGPGKPVTFYYVGRPMRLAHDPHLARFRYEVGG